MAAISTALLTFVRPGDVVLHSGPLYGGSDYFVRHYLPELGVHPICLPAGCPIAVHADKVRAEGAKAADALSSAASGRTDAAVDLLLNAIHDA